MEYVWQIIDLPKPAVTKISGVLLGLGRHIHDHFIPHPRNNYHPHILGHRALGLFSALLVTVKIFTIALLAWGPIVPAFSSAITETNIISLTNASRQQSNLLSLTENSELDKAAQAKADDMLARGYFAHNTPDGRTPWSFITAAGYSYLMAGENLAVNFVEAEDVETAWMNSPGHRANILNKNFEEIGIGISQGQYQGHNAIFVVQEFGTPAGEPVTLSDQPTQVQTAAVPLPAAAAAPASTTAPAKQLAQNKPVTEIRGESVPTNRPTQSTASQPATVPNNNQNLNQPITAAQPETVNVENGQIKFDGGNVDIIAQVLGPAVKVLAYFGQQAVMLAPQPDGSWSGEVAAANLAQTNLTVRLLATGMLGQTSQLQLADFAPTTVDNFHPANIQPAQSYVSFLGQAINPTKAEQNFYLLFIAGLLASLVLAIGLKRHVQHLSLIANSSFVVVLAVMLWFGG